MPAPALPVPRNEDMVTIRLIRRFRDAIGRSLSGNVTIAGTGTQRVGDTVVVPSSTVALIDGLLDVRLVPDTYQLSGTLVTADRAEVAYDEVVTLTAEPERPVRKPRRPTRR